MILGRYRVRDCGCGCGKAKIVEKVADAPYTLDIGSTPMTDERLQYGLRKLNETWTNLFGRKQ